MNHKKCVIALGIMVVVGMVLTSCGTPSPWDALYEAVPPDLCPRDKEPDERPTFATPVQTLYEDEQVWVQHGLFANEDGELFRINVIGDNSDAVERYTDDVRVCVDQILTGTVTADARSEPSSDELSIELAKTNNLIIQVYLVGIFDPQYVSGKGLIGQLLGYSAPEWGSILREMEMTPQQARPEEPRQDYVVDFAIDPNIEDEGTHYYQRRAAMYAIVDVSVAGTGAGSVGAELFRDAVSADATTVERGEGLKETDTLETENGGTRHIYDLTVQGKPSGTYQLSGRAIYDAERADWYYGYVDDPMPCTSEDFCLERPRGESANLPIVVTTAETPIPKVDVLLLFDVTSSMEQEIEEVKKNASYFMETVKEGVDAAFGVGSFADYLTYYDYAGYADTYGESSDYPWSLDLDITTDTGQLQSTLDVLELRSGGDFPESYSRALFEALSVSWRPETKKVIVLFGDAVAHDYEFFPAAFGVNTGVDPGEDEIPGTDDDLAFTKVVEDVREAGITVISINSAPADQDLVAAFFDYLAKETGGQAFNLAAATEAPEAVVRGLEVATEWINELTISTESDTETDFDSWVMAEPTAYNYVGGGESLSFEVAITVPADIEPSLYEFALIVLADGAKLDEFPVMLNVPQ